MSRFQRVQIAIRRLHLWLGLGLGLLFALLGLTGSTLIFYTGIDAAIHSEIRGERSPAAAWNSPVWDRALATGRARWHDSGGKWTFELTGQGGAIPARYYPHATGHHADRLMVWFSADGTRILRAEPWGGYLMSWLYQLHMQLLVGDVGGQIVGWSGVAILLLLASGLIAWWPRGSWRKALAFKRDAAPSRRLRDLHKLTGLWSAGLLLVLVGSGVLLALPQVTQVLLRPRAIPAPVSPASGVRQVTVVVAMAAARRAIPDGRIVFVDVPSGQGVPIRVRMQVPGDPHARFPGSYVFVDGARGRVLAVRDLRTSGVGARMLAWVRPLHDGSVGGTTTRLLAMVVGAMPAVLLVTGLLRWSRRRQTSRRDDPQGHPRQRFRPS